MPNNRTMTPSSQISSQSCATPSMLMRGLSLSTPSSRWRDLDTKSPSCRLNNTAKELQHPARLLFKSTSETRPCRPTSMFGQSTSATRQALLNSEPRRTHLIDLTVLKEPMTPRKAGLRSRDLSPSPSPTSSPSPSFLTPQADRSEDVTTTRTTRHPIFSLSLEASLSDDGGDLCDVETPIDSGEDDNPFLALPARSYIPRGRDTTHTQEPMWQVYEDSIDIESLPERSRGARGRARSNRGASSEQENIAPSPETRPTKRVRVDKEHMSRQITPDNSPSHGAKLNAYQPREALREIFIELPKETIERDFDPAQNVCESIEDGFTFKKLRSAKGKDESPRFHITQEELLSNAKVSWVEAAQDTEREQKKNPPHRRIATRSYSNIRRPQSQPAPMHIDDDDLFHKPCQSSLADMLTSTNRIEGASLALSPSKPSISPQDRTSSLRVTQPCRKSLSSGNCSGTSSRLSGPFHYGFLRGAKC